MHDIWAAILSAMGQWHQGKLFLEHSVAVEHDALHVIVGLLAWLGIAGISRRPLSSWTPFLWLVALILWNEAVDLWVEQWPDAGQQYGEGFKDFALTILMPALLMVLVRRRPGLFATSVRRKR
ncbi:MAG: hypothetical protein V4444_06570 [Pseudomonadota bacterium]